MSRLPSQLVMLKPPVSVTLPSHFSSKPSPSLPLAFNWGKHRYCWSGRLPTRKACEGTNRPTRQLHASSSNSGAYTKGFYKYPDSKDSRSLRHQPWQGWIRRPNGISSLVLRHFFSRVFPPIDDLESALNPFEDETNSPPKPEWSQWLIGPQFKILLVLALHLSLCSLDGHWSRPAHSTSIRAWGHFSSPCFRRRIWNYPTGSV